MIIGTLKLKDGSVVTFEKPSMDEAVAYAEQWYSQTEHILLVTVEEQTA